MNALPIYPAELKPGDSLCYEKVGFIARSIQILTRSKVGHTSLVGHDGYIYEALPQGYVRNTLHRSLADGCVKVYVKRPKFNVDETVLRSALNDMRKAKYEFAGIYHQLKRIVFGKWKGDKEAKKNVFCSKANAYWFMKAGVLDYQRDWYSISPDMIAEDTENFDTYELIF